MQLRGFSIAFPDNLDTRVVMEPTQEVFSTAVMLFVNRSLGQAESTPSIPYRGLLTLRGVQHPLRAGWISGIARNSIPPDRTGFGKFHSIVTFFT